MRASIFSNSFRYSFSNLTLVLICVNVIVHLITTVAPRAVFYLAMVPSLVVNSRAYWQFLTYMFVHSNFSHILFNMLGLFFFGTGVERRIGSREFLMFYLITGTLAGFFSFLVYFATGDYNVVLVGASGAVYAVLLAFATYYPEARIYIFGVFPVRAPILVLLYTVISVFSQLSGRGTNIAHLTHLAGFIFAFLYFLIRLHINPIKVFMGGRYRG